MTDHVKNLIKEISTPKEFNYLLDNFSTSNQPIEVKTEAIETLKDTYPYYHEGGKLVDKQRLEDIRACEADIDGME